MAGPTGSRADSEKLGPRSGPEVIALVGPAGTGKSHRASIVALEVGAEAILDDGLLIVEGRILAGRSAKRETTRVAATRRALLEEPGHAADVREALRRVAPRRLLVIGISEEMARRAAENLGLAAPTRVVAIEEVASPRQMRKARRLRRSEGKHVIPAPTLEVRRSLPGYTVDPLRVFVKRPEERTVSGRFVEKSVVRPTFSSLGHFYIEEVVLAAIAARAAVEVRGVSRVYQSEVAVGPAGVSFKLAVGAAFGVYLPEVAAAVRDHVKRVVEHMTALTCERVDVKVAKVLPRQPA